MLFALDLGSSLSKVMYQKIRVATNLYGVNCNVHYPSTMGAGFMNYSDIQYDTNPDILNQKFLIPKAVLVRNNNSYTQLGYLVEDGEIFLWSAIQIPRYSKIIVNELYELFSFIVSEIEFTEEIRSQNIYYKYTIVPSASITVNEIPLITEIASLEESQQPSAIVTEEQDINKVSTITPNTSIIIGRV
jgi:hypothetical protein